MLDIMLQLLKEVVNYQVSVAGNLSGEFRVCLKIHILYEGCIIVC
jgi:hypothetical protein